jgi:hypothetical protein
MNAVAGPRYGLEASSVDFLPARQALPEVSIANAAKCGVDHPKQLSFLGVLVKEGLFVEDSGGLIYRIRLGLCSSRVLLLVLNTQV